MAKVIRVPKVNAESVRADAARRGALDRRFRIISEGDMVMIPVTGDVEGYDAHEIEMEPSEQRETDYRNLVKIGAELRGTLPSSFDVIGDVAVVKIPEPLMGHRNEIGDAIIGVTGNIRVVVMDSGVKGDLRIRELETIAGTGTTETVHKEFGVRMAIDPSKVYFNPRLAAERMRVASQVRRGEVIIDMFAGAAPFPLVIAKHADPEAVYAIDLNPDAKEFMERNIRMNKTDRIIPVQGDSRTALRTTPKADRIIMNLPQSAIDFLGDALASLKEGGTIHLYRIMERDAGHGDIIEAAKASGFDVHINERIELKTYSPTMSVFVFDIVRIT